LSPRDRFVTGPGPDAGGTIQGSEPWRHMPEKSGTCLPAAGAACCPTAGVAAINAANKTKSHRAFMTTSPFRIA
jgi:hypothetical protein